MTRIWTKEIQLICRLELILKRKRTPKEISTKYFFKIKKYQNGVFVLIKRCWFTKLLRNLPSTRITQLVIHRHFEKKLLPPTKMNEIYARKFSSFFYKKQRGMFNRCGLNRVDKKIRKLVWNCGLMKSHNFKVNENKQRNH